MMKFFKKMFGWISGSNGPEERYFIYRVKCKRCGEIIEGRIDLTNDLSREYEGKEELYFVRKVLMGDGSNRCYQKMEVGMKFDTNRNLLEKIVENGAFVEG